MGDKGPMTISYVERRDACAETLQFYERSQDKFQLQVLQGYIDEILQGYIRRILYAVQDGIRSLMLWRNQVHFGSASSNKVTKLLRHADPLQALFVTTLFL